MKAYQPVLCTCCKSELTKPQFYKGKPYGWTCIKKVAPKAQQTKDVWIQGELVSFDKVSDNALRIEAIAKANGRTYKSFGYLSNSGEFEGAYYIGAGGEIKLTEFGKPVWRGHYIDQDTKELIDERTGEVIIKLNRRK